MSDHYVLDGHKPIPVDWLTWGRWFEKQDRRVARETVAGCDVSTVFLGLDHSFGSGPPLLFETMVFGGPLDEEQQRYSTWEEAEAGHRAMVARVRAAARWWWRWVGRPRRALLMCWRELKRRMR